jgi:hypothetical protein
MECVVAIVRRLRASRLGRVSWLRSAARSKQTVGRGSAGVCGTERAPKRGPSVDALMLAGMHAFVVCTQHMRRGSQCHARQPLAGSAPAPPRAV